MCERAKNEPLLAFWFRQFKEEPLRVLLVLGISAIAYLYQEGNARWGEYRRDMKEQNAALITQLQASTQVMYEMKTQLETLNSRVEHLEREHEQARRSSHE